VSFPNARLDAGDREVETVTGLLARPDGQGPFPAVVLLHSCGGFTSHVTSDWPNYLTGLGYVALGVDTFGSRGYQRCPNPLWRAGATWMKDAYGALDYLAAQPFVDKNRIAVMGFSLGANYINGSIVPGRARAGGLDFKAAIGFYGHCSYYPKGSIPLMEIAAEMDPSHRHGCEAAARAYPEIEVHVIPGAYHAFDSVEASGKLGAIGERMEYSWQATKKSRELTKAFLARHLGGRPGS
ncbi:MAG: dienelactone hydrolase family protein, partial [Rhodospirillales bacterium]